MSVCLACESSFTHRWQKKFCSNKCQQDFQYQQFKERWLDGASINTFHTSAHIKRYLRETFGDACSLCGWEEKNPVTGRVPTEVDHIDGNAENNAPANLRIICPNCHSLTPSFRNLNRGHGRTRRIQRIRAENKRQKDGQRLKISGAI